MDEILNRALAEGRYTLSEYESKEFLRAYGIPVTKEVEAAKEEDFRAALEEIGFPMVIKACGWNLTHKTESGLVRVDIRDRKEAMTAFEYIMGRIEGDGGKVLVQEMVKGQRELVVGLTRDTQFGPCVMFGLGGIFTEILADISFRMAPFKKSDALDMMNEIRGRKILGPLRGMPAADLDQLADILINIGKIGVEQKWIKEIDLNPVILREGKPVAVDALVVLEEA